MPKLNSVLLEGNLVRDPELRQLPSGSLLSTYTIATNRSFQRRDGSLHSEVSYFDCESWGPEAQRCHDTLKKGSGIKVVGRLRQDRWQDKESKNHSKIKIIAEYFELLDYSNTPEKLAEQCEDLHRSAEKKASEYQGAC